MATGEISAHFQGNGGGNFALSNAGSGINRLSAHTAAVGKDALVDITEDLGGAVTIKVIQAANVHVVVVPDGAGPFLYDSAA